MFTDPQQQARRPAISLAEPDSAVAELQAVNEQLQDALTEADAERKALRQAVAALERQLGALRQVVAELGGDAAATLGREATLATQQRQHVLDRVAAITGTRPGSQDR